VSDLSDLEEDFVFVEEIQENPANKGVTCVEYHFAPRTGTQAGQPAEEKLVGVTETHDGLDHINGNGVHTDYNERQYPFSVTFDVDEPVEKGEHRVAVCADDENEGAAPKLFVDWENAAPREADN